MTATQASPVPGQDYRKMPRHTVSAETQMYRAHNTVRNAWWFDSSGNGRFNLSASAGTCYTATNVERAVREKVRDAVSESNVVSRALADSFRASTLAAPIEYKCAAVSAARRSIRNRWRAGHHGRLRHPAGMG